MAETRDSVPTAPLDRLTEEQLEETISRYAEHPDPMMRRLLAELGSWRAKVAAVEAIRSDEKRHYPLGFRNAPVVYLSDLVRALDSTGAK